MKKVKNQLTKANLAVLSCIKKSKKGVHKTQLVECCGLSFGGVAHHVSRLVKAKKVKVDKKTRLLTAVK